jgi:hypothetical protein
VIPKARPVATPQEGISLLAEELEELAYRLGVLGTSCDRIRPRLIERPADESPARIIQTYSNNQIIVDEA